MIELDLNLSYLAQHFQIAPTKLAQYKNKSIQEILEEEVKAGNLQALQFASSISDPSQLSKLFSLANYCNRYLIIKGLDDDILGKILEKLPTQDLLSGIHYFNMDKLFEMLEELPPEELLNVVFQKFGLANIVQLMNVDELDAFFESPNVERADIQKTFKQFDKELLDKIMFQSLGIDTREKSRKEIFEHISSMDDTQFNQFILGMKKNHKQALVFGLCQNDKKLMLELDPKAIARPLMALEKGEIIQCMEVLDPKFVIPMVQELPEELVQVVAAQIDPMQFADILIKNCPDILSKIKI